jgi:hypothetical protein
MNRLGRVLAILALLAAVLPEAQRYRAEALLADANGRLDAVLHGEARGPDAGRAVAQAALSAEQAARWLPGDPRPPLAQGIALLFQQRGKEAEAVLAAAVAQGERPELTLNLGRARGISGDAAGADAAFLRAAWVGPAAVATLPAPLRKELSERVAVLEIELREGRLGSPPPIR